MKVCLLREWGAYTDRVLAFPWRYECKLDAVIIINPN
jgi:hypothetical protein